MGLHTNLISAFRHSGIQNKGLHQEIGLLKSPHEVLLQAPKILNPAPLKSVTSHVTSPRRAGVCFKALGSGSNNGLRRLQPNAWAAAFGAWSPHKHQKCS